MKKAIAILPVVSAIYPMITGVTAPPTIVMISNEEASLVFVPASLNANEKIVGNMMHSPRYRAKNAMSNMVLLQTTTMCHSNIMFKEEEKRATRLHPQKVA